MYGKLVDRTLSDIDYTELSNMVYGQTYSSDVARRMMYGSRRTLELMDSEQINATTNSKMLSELQLKITELQKERQRFFDQRREYNKLVSRDGRQEHLNESLISAADNLSTSIGQMYDNTVHEELSFNGNEAVLVFSDWHYGMKTSNIFNEYNTDICKQRVRRTVELASERIRVNQCSKLHIVILGDAVHGAVHVSARVASEELVCEQLMQVSEILAQSICELSKCVKDTVVYMTYGNHARTIQNKHDSIHRDNMERMIPWWLEQRLQPCENITITTPSDNEFLFLNVCGHDMCAAHGDLDSVKSSPRLLATLFHKKYGKDIEYIILGDKHHIESFNELGVTSMICGSLCGTDDYANNKRLFSYPSQLLLIVNKENGVDAEYKLKC